MPEDTIYKGQEVPLSLTWDSEPASGDGLYCPNDDCPRIEVVRDDDGDLVEVIRLAWDPQWVDATGPTYSSGGEPGYADRPECPCCWSGGENTD